MSRQNRADETLFLLCRSNRSMTTFHRYRCLNGSQTISDKQQERKSHFFKFHIIKKNIWNDGFWNLLKEIQREEWKYLKQSNVSSLPFSLQGPILSLSTSQFSDYTHKNVF